MADSCMPADYYINANRCVCCGTTLPEGYQYCGSCAEHHKLKNGLDTVEVVRCENCKHLTMHNSPTLYAYCEKTHFRFEPFKTDTRTHFCSYGERKESEVQGE